LSQVGESRRQFDPVAKAILGLGNEFGAIRTGSAAVCTSTASMDR
jgi:hypothetical protein